MYFDNNYQCFVAHFVALLTGDVLGTRIDSSSKSTVKYGKIEYVLSTLQYNLCIVRYEYVRLLNQAELVAYEWRVRHPSAPRLEKATIGGASKVCHHCLERRAQFTRCKARRRRR